ncbi:synapse-associated protein 1-like isoform X2 [Amphiprion ocellaris]|uniref:synapse-associated protein 1-like isoform X2 n=1 Tax=Amphiprion ocellaris TaxID=80972 RepID=UPI0024118204|nr:synapse-associated protein 1-like isoform X2 [Amphiprion ocellaris]
MTTCSPKGSQQSQTEPIRELTIQYTRGSGHYVYSMFKNWGTWLGIENENAEVKQETESVVDAEEDTNCGVNKPADEREQTSAAEKDDQLLQKAKGLGGYIYNFASSASKKLSESVVETAQTLKKSVEEGKINGIIDKTILGDFQKEQERFVQEQKAKKSGAAVPPWVGYNEEETTQQQILALSADKRNFLRDPPAGVQFHFDFEQMYPVAMVMLEEDELLRKMRFHLVPKQVKEEAFWKNYFYRVSLIKQSAQLTALAAQQAAERRDMEKTSPSHEELHHIDVVKRKSPPAIHRTKPKSSEDEEEISTSPPVSEFVSDAFDSCKINEADLRKEMEQLVLDKREHPTPQEEETADWERELQEELQEYDVLADNDNRDDNWDREIEEMLKEDS